MKLSTINKQGIAAGIGLVLCTSALANQWRPISSERLIKLPAPVMAKALEQDFRDSDLATSLTTSQENLGDIKVSLERLTAGLVAATEDDVIPARHNLLKKKSAYLDEMEQHQLFQRQAAVTKLKIYETLLKHLQRDRRRANDPVSREIRAAQLSSRARMQANRQKVNDNLFPAAATTGTKYTQDYEDNLDKIRQLQAAIRSHEANRSATLDGEVVSREAFVRHLLAEAEADVALLDQEDEMLGYMARLVALDAQALQIEVAYGAGSQDVAQQNEPRPRNMVDFFIK